MPKLVWELLGIYLIIANLIAFILMGIDKRRAKKEKWRIRERTLFLPTILGGALGGTLGMRIFHHKTNHWYFRFGFPILLILQIVLISFLFGKFGIA